MIRILTLDLFVLVFAHSMSFYAIVLSISFLVSLFVKSELKYFVVFLGVCCLFEIIVVHWSIARFGSNILAYNLFVLLTVSYYLFVFCRTRKELSVLLTTYIIGGLINFSLIDIQTEVASKNYAFGLIIVGVLIVREIKSKLESNLIDHFFKDSKFWFGLGILLFLSCSFPILVFTDVLVVSQSAHKIYGDLLRVGNVLLHLGYLMVLICETKWIKLLG